MRFLRRLFGWKKKVDRSKTTKKFVSFLFYQMSENERKKEYDSRQNLLVKFIISTKSSPWEEDHDLEEARKFLIEMGITEKIL